MKLAKIILPLMDNEGKDLLEEHQHLKHALLVRYGGFTCITSQGSWKAPNGVFVSEVVQVYEVAMERAAVTEFRLLAIDYCRLCRQETVMIVTPCGDVEFVHPLPEKQGLTAVAG